MKTLEETLERYKDMILNSYILNRLAQFVSYDKLKSIGVEFENVTEEQWNTSVIPFTRENILKNLELDVAYGFKVALDRRWAEASFMYDVVEMWNWVLEEGLEDWSYTNYPHYGLPLFRATAIKYNFNNPIDSDSGREEKYNN